MPSWPSDFAPTFTAHAVVDNLSSSLCPEYSAPPQHDVAQYSDTQWLGLDDWWPSPPLDVSLEPISCSPAPDLTWHDVDEPSPSLESFTSQRGRDQLWDFKDYDCGRIRPSEPSHLARWTPQYSSMPGIDTSDLVTPNPCFSIYHGFGGGWQAQPSSGVEICPTPPPSCGTTKSEDEDVDWIADGRYSCKECRMVFGASHGLERHAKTTEHRAYVCSCQGCESTYYRRDSYLRHLKSHRDTSLHVCRVCEQVGKERAFKRKDHLLQHIRGQHPRTRVSDGVGSSPRLHVRSSCAS